jgi:transcriptional regulator with XRE-family HTH domain
MKKIIEELEAKGAEENKSLRDYAKELGIAHSTLSRYKKPDRKFGEFFRVMEGLRKQLKYSKSKMWDKLTGS